MISRKLKKIIEEDKKYLFQNYGDRLPACFVRGDGAYLFDQDGKKYIDFFSGIAVSNVGYKNRALTRAIHAQTDRILHTSNWYYNMEQIKAAKLMSEISFPGKTLFVNSGTEANEAAIKLARKYGLSTSEKRYEIISFKNSFHGRTMGSMTATGQGKIHEGFGPLPPGFIYLPYNDIESFRKEVSLNKNIAAVMIELIQGEGGIIVADKNFVKEVFAICRDSGICTIIDEIQTGMGRTGKLFGYQHYGITPDAITVAKGLGGGFPVGALHTKKEMAEFFTRGTHGSTFGGNHLASAAAIASMGEVKKTSFLKNVKSVGAFFFEQFNQMKKEIPLVKEVRGMGLHIGLELNIPCAELITQALKMGLVINCTAEKTIRIMPPLNIRMSTARVGLRILKRLLIQVQG